MAPVFKDKKVTPADNNNKKKTTTTPSVLVVRLWALSNAVVFAVFGFAKLILNLFYFRSCTKSTWLFHCVWLTDAAAAEVTFLLFGEVLCSAAAALAAALPMLLATTETTVDALAWVALAATAGTHGMKIAYDSIFLAAADAGDTRNVFFDVVLRYILVAVDLLLAGVLLCCSPRRLELVGVQKGDDDGVVV